MARRSRSGATRDACRKHGQLRHGSLEASLPEEFNAATRVDAEVVGPEGIGALAHPAAARGDPATSRAGPRCGGRACNAGLRSPPCPAGRGLGLPGAAGLPAVLYRAEGAQGRPGRTALGGAVAGPSLSAPPVAGCPGLYERWPHEDGATGAFRSLGVPGRSSAVSSSRRNWWGAWARDLPSGTCPLCRRGPTAGPTVIVPHGPPMELTATGTVVRRALVLILHDSAQPPGRSPPSRSLPVVSAQGSIATVEYL